MNRYAYINEEGYVISINESTSIDTSENAIPIGNIQVQLESYFDRETGEFTPPDPQPISEPQPTTEEIQTQILLNTEYLVVVSELSNL